MLDWNPPPRPADAPPRGPPLPLGPCEPREEAEPPLEAEDVEAPAVVAGGGFADLRDKKGRSVLCLQFGGDEWLQ